MKIKTVTRTALVVAMSASFIVPQVPYRAWANSKPAGFSASDLFPEDGKDNKEGDKDSIDGLFPSIPTIPQPGNNNGGSSNGGAGNNNGGFVRTNSGGKGGTNTQAQKSGATMATAKVDPAYACLLFENRPHSALIQSIDSLMAQVKASQECSDSPSMSSIESNTKTLRDSVTAMQGMMDADPATLNAASIEQSITGAANAINNIGEIINNNSFLNSACGRQTMSLGKVLLSFNDIINGLAPFALMASVANPALAPIMLGTTAVSTSIKAVENMFNQGTLDMTNPNHRKAVLENTCQYTKVAKKVRFMQLAQSGRIERIGQEMAKDVEFYRSNINQPSDALKSLLKFENTINKSLTNIEDQLSADKADYTAVVNQMKVNNDDLMVCTLSRELVNWAQDGKTFPSSAFNNLQAAADTQNERSAKLQANTFKSVHATSMKRIIELANQAGNGSESAMKACAQTGRSWITSMGQAVNMTSQVINSAKTSLQNYLNASTEYRQFNNYYNQVKIQEETVTRVEKAMRELAKDTSVIDRSELAQRMTALKGGLFGTRKTFGFSNPPVLQWIEHTKTMHDRAVSSFLGGLKTLQAGAFSLTASAQGKAVIKSVNGGYVIDTQKQVDDMKNSQALKTLNLKNLPLGSLANERACQQLEVAWLDYSAAIDHLGAIQLFCDMINPVLEDKMDGTLITACRGNAQLSGKGYIQPLVKEAYQVLNKKGYKAYSDVITGKLKELQCPTPAVSVMNE